jgi:hypothetical protein
MASSDSWVLRYMLESTHTLDMCHRFTMKYQMILVLVSCASIPIVLMRQVRYLYIYAPIEALKLLW